MNRNRPFLSFRQILRLLQLNIGDRVIDLMQHRFDFAGIGDIAVGHFHRVAGDVQRGGDLVFVPETRVQVGSQLHRVSDVAGDIHSSIVGVLADIESIFGDFQRVHAGFQDFAGRSELVGADIQCHLLISFVLNRLDRVVHVDHAVMHFLQKRHRRRRGTEKRGKQDCSGIFRHFHRCISYLTTGR